MSAIAQELLALQQAGGGLLQVEPTVEWAQRHKNSALYKALEWDDAVGGHQWRCQQVRQLIQLHIVSSEGARQTVSLSIDRVRKGGGYRDLQDVLDAPDMRAVLLHDALEDLQRIYERYCDVTELAGVWQAFELVKRQKPTKPKGGARRKQKPSERRPSA